MNQQEYFMQVQMLGQEAEKLEQQMQIMEQQINELTAVRESIVAIKESNSDEKEKNTEILANLGKGIFVKADLKEKNLYINIGKDVIVKKSPEDTIKIIDQQLEKLSAGKESLMERIQQLQIEMNNILQRARKEEESSRNSHQHAQEHHCEDEECECEEPCEECECEHEKKGKKK